jgi:hypothetical protein
VRFLDPGFLRDDESFINKLLGLAIAVRIAAEAGIPNSALLRRHPRIGLALDARTSFYVML